MAGSATAASLITSKQIKDGTIQTRDLSKKAIRALKGHVGARGDQGPAGAQGPTGAQGPPGAQGPAGGATGAAGGDLTGDYPNPSIRAGAVDGSKLSPIEAYHKVGSAGEPAYEGNWVDSPLSGYVGVRFRKDRDGVVHLAGDAHSTVVPTGATTLFTLPPGYRPAGPVDIPVFSGNGAGHYSPAAIEVEPAGQVVVFPEGDSTLLGVDNVTFYAAG